MDLRATHRLRKHFLIPSPQILPFRGQGTQSPPFIRIFPWRWIRDTPRGRHREAEQEDQEEEAEEKDAAAQEEVRARVTKEKDSWPVLWTPLAEGHFSRTHPPSGILSCVHGCSKCSLRGSRPPPNPHLLRLLVPSMRLGPPLPLLPPVGSPWEDYLFRFRPRSRFWTPLTRKGWGSITITTRPTAGVRPDEDALRDLRPPLRRDPFRLTVLRR